jgi:Bacteriophage tail sheath protein
MAQYKTPGVFIEEISKMPPSVAAVATAVPVFIGPTEKAVDQDGASLVKKPRRITSFLEYEQLFGGPGIHTINVKVAQTGSDIKVAFNAATDPGLPAHFLYYSMQMFYANGGGPCYVISTGGYAAAAAKADFTDAITSLESWDEPTLLVFPDACLLTAADHKDIVDAALAHCKKMQDRFTIADVRNAVPDGVDTNAEIDGGIRSGASDASLVKYGAAYFPYLNTSLPFVTDDTHIVIKSASGTAVVIAADAPVGSIKTSLTDVYNAVKRFANAALVTLPPSGAVAGAYARTDADRGVWKAPANVSLLNVVGPAIQITNDLNDALNVDPTSGKSVNAIRAFTGKGTLIWGARTLAGNDNENRYVNVRRFLIFAEESIKKATSQFVFEPNDANTWVKVGGMIENFLTLQWRDGALAGAKPEDAFYVAIGLGKTMSAQDILNGYMIVEIGLAIVRPAEFIVLKFVQLMQKS